MLCTLCCRYVVPCLKWLGVLSCMLDDVERSVWQPLTARDHSLINTLKTGPLEHLEEWTNELDLMVEWNCKADIEALYSITGFEWFSQALAESLRSRLYLN